MGSKRTFRQHVNAMLAKLREDDEGVTREEAVLELVCPAPKPGTVLVVPEARKRRSKRNAKVLAQQTREAFAAYQRDKGDA